MPFSPTPPGRLAALLCAVLLTPLNTTSFAQSGGSDPDASIGRSDPESRSDPASEQAVLAQASQAYMDEEYLTAHSLWRPLADAGNNEARTNLGILARYGMGVVQDFSVALYWYQLAAEQGYPRGQYQLGLMHEYGLGVGQSDAAAVRWYRASAAQEYVRAQFALGVMFAEGRGVAKDVVEAARWYHRAAEQGDANAQNILGRLYVSGEGIGRDEAAALHWFALAAQQGHADAQMNLRAACEQVVSVECQ